MKPLSHHSHRAHVVILWGVTAVIVVSGYLALAQPRGWWPFAMPAAPESVER
ncbi:MAG TPA: hypothetical protein VD862_03050 [Candidatus Paceibacterota bacterium]|nr:hypothetical protein [Candidatus Paceibacterota bacterium]